MARWREFTLYRFWENKKCTEALAAAPRQREQLQGLPLPGAEVRYGADGDAGTCFMGAL
jgi:hypothetical protein